MELLSGFFWALEGMSLEIAGSLLRAVDFDEISYHFHQESNFEDVRFIVITDSLDNPDIIKKKVQEIAKLFFELYSNSIDNFTGDVSQYEKFGKILIEKGITKKNCGKYFDCEECPKSDREKRLLGIFKRTKKELLKSWLDKGKNLKLGEPILRN